jgi:hypothetical protein
MSALLSEKSNASLVPQLPPPGLDPAFLQLWKAGVEWQSRVGPFGVGSPAPLPGPTPLPDKERGD